MNFKGLLSKADGRRVISQNGLSINDEKVSDVNLVVSKDMLIDGSMIIKKGKKVSRTEYDKIMMKQFEQMKDGDGNIKIQVGG